MLCFIFILPGFPGLQEIFIIKWEFNPITIITKKKHLNSSNKCKKNIIRQILDSPTPASGSPSTSSLISPLSLINPLFRGTDPQKFPVPEILLKNVQVVHVSSLVLLIHPWDHQVSVQNSLSEVFRQNFEETIVFVQQIKVFKVECRLLSKEVCKPLVVGNEDLSLGGFSEEIGERAFGDFEKIFGPLVSGSVVLVVLFWFFEEFPEWFSLWEFSPSISQA